MARVTVEDCIEKVPSRFELVLVAAHRARQLANGASPYVLPDNDRYPVIALREIAEGRIGREQTLEILAKQLSRGHMEEEPEDSDEELAEALAQDTSWAGVTETPQGDHIVESDQDFDLASDTDEDESDETEEASPDTTVED